VIPTLMQTRSIRVVEMKRVVAYVDCYQTVSRARKRKTQELDPQLRDLGREQVTIAWCIIILRLLVGRLFNVQTADSIDGSTGR
jgi:hypothetical protein